MTAGKAVLFTVVLLALLGVWALVRRSSDARSMFDTIADGYTPPPAADTSPPVVFLPDGFTCLRCEENPALPTGLWCAVCDLIVDAFPAEPIDRHGLAGKQRKTGGDR